MNFNKIKSLTILAFWWIFLINFFYLYFLDECRVLIHIVKRNTKKITPIHHQNLITFKFWIQKVISQYTLYRVNYEWWRAVCLYPSVLGHVYTKFGISFKSFSQHMYVLTTKSFQSLTNRKPSFQMSVFLPGSPELKIEQKTCNQLNHRGVPMAVCVAIVTKAQGV